MKTIEYERINRELDHLISQWHSKTKADTEIIDNTDRTIDYLKSAETVLDFFKGIDADLSTKIISSCNLNLTGHDSFREMIPRLFNLQTRVITIESLIEEASRFDLVSDAYDKTVICTSAENLVNYCKNDMVCDQLDDKTDEVEKTIAEMMTLVSYLKSDQSTLDVETDSLKKRLSSMSGYADRHGCKKTLRQINQSLDLLPSGNFSKDLATVRSLSHNLDSLREKFEKEEKEATAIYRQVCSRPVLLWKDQLDKFKRTYESVRNHSTARNNDFNLDSFRTEADKLLKIKGDDIEKYTLSKPALSKRYEESLKREIIDSACSCDDFIAWQNHVRDLERTRKNALWKKSFKILGYVIFSPVIIIWLIIKSIYDNWSSIWPVLKVILCIIGFAFVIFGFIIKFFLNIATNSADRTSSDY